MNAPISRLFVLVVVLFAALIGFTSRWTVFQASDLRANSLNKRDVLTEQRVRRGRILASDRTVLARSVPAAHDTFRRTYPDPASAFAQTVGYSFPNPGRTGLEQSYNEFLGGTHNELKSILDDLRGRRREGDDLLTTLDPAAQKAALAGLAGRAGAVVAIEPDSGAIRVMASTPTYDPGAASSQKRFSALNHAAGSPLINRATQARYPPGSTFKVVTAIAAIDSGRYTPQSQVSGKNGIKISGVPLNNDANESFGMIDLTTALTKSVNTVWAQVAEDLGKPTMKKYMERLGFDQRAPVDLPESQRVRSGVIGPGGVRSPTSRLVDIGRVGIGQEKLLVTPLQMAMVAAAVANHGTLMRPHIGDRVIDADGRTVERVAPKRLSQVMSEQTAAQVGQMMQQVVKEGTGTAAALQGIDVAGKTGTAELNPQQRINQPWFIAFAPAGHPKVAVAVTVERVVGGFGGVVAAPIAKSVIQELLK